MIINLDLDGTLLTNKKEVLPFTTAVLKALKKQGHIIVINSMRTYSRTKPLISKIKPDYLVCNGGSLILTKNGKILYEDFLKYDFLNYLISEFVNNGIEFNLQDKKYLYIIDYKEKKSIIDMPCKPLKMPFEKKIYKILCETKTSEQENLVRSLCDNNGLEFVVLNGGGSGKVFKKNVNKQTGIQELIKILNMPSSDCISFGDDMSDFVVFKWSKISACPSNSVPEIKKIATYICDDNNQEGVAHFLNNYFKLNVKG